MFIKSLFGHRPDVSRLILRIALGVIFLAHGVLKFQGGVGYEPGGVAFFFKSVGIPLPLLFAWIVSLVETIGGIALILGIFVREFAFALSITMIVAIFSLKLSKGLVGGYEFELILLAASLSLMFEGAGRFSVERATEGGMHEMRNKMNRPERPIEPRI